MDLRHLPWQKENKHTKYIMGTLFAIIFLTVAQSISVVHARWQKVFLLRWFDMRFVRLHSNLEFQIYFSSKNSLLKSSLFLSVEQMHWATVMRAMEFRFS